MIFEKFIQGVQKMPQIFPSLLATSLMTSCLQVDDFDVPEQQETYTGSYYINSGLEGFSSGAYTTNAVTVDTDEDGETVYVASVPSNNPFPLIPTSIFDQVKLVSENYDQYDQAPEVTGFVGKLAKTPDGKKDPTRVIFEDFFKKNDTAEDLEPWIVGEMVKSGMKMKLSAKIMVRAENLIEMLTMEKISNSDRLTNAIVKMPENLALKNMDPDTEMVMYKIDGKFNGLTVTADNFLNKVPSRMNEMVLKFYYEFIQDRFASESEIAMFRFLSRTNDPTVL